MYETVITVDCKKLPVECGYLGGSDKQGGNGLYNDVQINRDATEKCSHSGGCKCFLCLRQNMKQIHTFNMVR